MWQAIEIDKIYDSEVYIFSNDGDFTEFVEEIPAHFNVNILKIDDDIPSSPTQWNKFGYRITNPIIKGKRKGKKD